MPMLNAWAFLYLQFGNDNEQAYNYYCQLKNRNAKKYWYKFLKARADRGIKDAQKYVDKIEGE